MCARIYDKTRQVDAKGLDYWPAIWGKAYDSELPVLRIEAEIGRQGLTEFGVNSPIDGLDRAADIWANVTEKWLSYRTPTSDETRSRWPVAPEWAAIQRAALRGDAFGVDRVRALKRRGQLRVIMPTVVGYLARVGALVGTDDLGTTLGAVRSLVADDEVRRGQLFADRIAGRVAEEALR